MNRKRNCWSPLPPEIFAEAYWMNSKTICILTGREPGIAFICALSGISVAASERVQAGKEQSNPNKQKEDMPMEARPMEMIVTVVDSDSTDLVVTAAKEAGAHGGTVIKAREVAGEEQKKIFGMIVQPEKEIVLMLVQAEPKKGYY